MNDRVPPRVLDLYAFSAHTYSEAMATSFGTNSVVSTTADSNAKPLLVDLSLPHNQHP